VDVKPLPTRDEVAAEECPHCKAVAGAPCINFGAPGEPMPDGYEFHNWRYHTALTKRLEVAIAGLQPTSPEDYRRATEESDAHDDACEQCSASMFSETSTKRCDVGQALVDACVDILERQFRSLQP